MSYQLQIHVRDIAELLDGLLQSMHACCFVLIVCLVGELFLIMKSFIHAASVIIAEWFLYMHASQP